MKTTKLITLLIFLAILSFSCSEDDDGKDDDSNINAADYLFLENNEYFFTTYKEKYLSKEIKETSINKHQIQISKNITEYGRNVIKYAYIDRDTTFNSIIWADSSIIFTRNSLINFHSIYRDIYKGRDLIPSINFSSSSWTVIEIVEKNENINIEEINTKTIAKKEKTIKFNFNGNNYNGIEFLFETNLNIYFNDKKGQIFELESFFTERVWIVKGLGLVKSEFNEVYKSNFDENEKKRKWTTVLSDIEKLN